MPIRLTRRLLKTLLSRPESHIVNMASICGWVCGGRFNAYHVSKFGLVGFSEALRAEFNRHGLGVTALCPGPVQTDLYKNSGTGYSDRETPRPARLGLHDAERASPVKPCPPFTATGPSRSSASRRTSCTTPNAFRPAYSMQCTASAERRICATS